MKKTINLSLLALTLISISCKMNQESLQKEETIGYGGISDGAERIYTNSELDIGRRICSNLKKKREFFEKLDNEKEQFKFRAELRNCDNGIYNTDLFIASISNANSTTPEYVADRKNYFRDVATDQSGIVKQVCDNIIQSNKVANTIYVNNFKYMVNLLIADGYDRYEVTKAKKNSSGKYDRLSSEAVSIIGQKIQAPVKFFGVEKERVIYISCNASGGGDRFSTLSQSWVEAVTNF